MAEPKTQPTNASVAVFLAAIEGDERRKDCRTIAALMKKATGDRARMWGDAIVGFGTLHYRYASGREGDTPIVAFSPRKQNLVLYLSSSFEQDTDLLDKLGKHKTGKVCLYLNRLSEVDLLMLDKLIRRSVAFLRKHPDNAVC